MSYQRVIPRDLFNESKLLKCLGQLALLVHEGQGGTLTIEHLSDDEGFLIEQNPNTDNLFCRNLSVSLEGRGEIFLGSRYNSKESYPLIFEIDDDYGDVFNDDGTFSAEFLQLIRSRS